MALGQADFPTTLSIDLEVKFNEGMKSIANQDWRRLIEVVPTDSNGKWEVFYGSNPRMRRFKAERQPQRFAEYKMNMNAERWELTMEYDRSEINRDQSGGILLNKISNFVGSVDVDLTQEFMEFLHNGSSIKGFDRANLYDFNHVYVDAKGATNTLVAAQSNMHLGGSQLDATIIQTEQFHYAQIKDDQNRSLGMRLTDVLVIQGSPNAIKARELNNSQFTVEASTVKGTMTENVFKGAFNIIETVYGFGASEWVSFALNNPEMKPVKVLSETRNPGFDSPRFSTVGIDSESDTSFWRGKVALGIEMNFGYNPGYWQTTRLHGSSGYVYTPADLENQRELYPNLF